LHYIKISVFCLKHTVPVLIDAHVYYRRLVHNLGTYSLQLLGPKVAEGWARGASKNFGTLYLFLQPLNVTTSNLEHNFGLGSSLPKQLACINKKLGCRRVAARCLVSLNISLIPSRPLKVIRNSTIR